MWPQLRSPDCACVSRMSPRATSGLRRDAPRRGGVETRPYMRTERQSHDRQHVCSARSSGCDLGSAELLFRLLTAKRWELLRALAAAGPVTIREAARRVNRDVKAVHGDVHALLDAGILQKTRDGLIAFPFDAIRVDVMLRAA